MAQPADRGAHEAILDALRSCWNIYIDRLRKEPLRTTSITSGVLGGVGSIIAQLLKIYSKSNSNVKFQLRPVVAMVIFGAVFTGPIFHYFYEWLNYAVPTSTPHFALKRLALDRLIVAPPFLAFFFVCVRFLEGKRFEHTLQFLASNFISSMIMNWKLWTPVQYVNLTYVPLQYRVLFGNVVSILWNTYLAAISD